MPIREVLKSITIARGPLVEVPGEKDGRGQPRKVASERHELKVGQKFDFTVEELEQIMATDPDAVSNQTVVTIDDDDVDLTKLGESQLAPNQQSGPGTTEDTL